MALDNPVLLLSTRTDLANTLQEHLILPKPYRLSCQHAIETQRMAMLLVDTGSRVVPETSAPVIALGKHDERALRHFPFPLRITELADALASLLPRMELSSLPVAIGASTCYFPLTRSLGQNAQSRILLTQKEAELLLHLLAAKGIELPREQLLSEIWGYGERANSHTLETHLYRLRQKLGAAGAHDVHILARGGTLALVT